MDTGITKRELATLGVRLIAIWFGFESLWMIVQLVIVAPTLLDTEPLSTLLLWAIPGPTRLAMVAALWYLADRLACWLFPQDGPAFAAGITIAALTPCGLLLLGVYFVVVGGSAIPSHYLGMGGPGDLLIAAIEFVAGLVLILGRSGLTRFVIWGRTVGITTGDRAQRESL